MKTPEIAHLLQQFDAIDRKAEELVGSLTEEQGVWRPDPSAWSVAECLDHLAITNRVYLDAMLEPSCLARQRNELRRGPAVPGIIGRWFVRSLEPPVKKYFKAKARKFVQPSPSPRLSDAFERFKTSQQRIREYIDEFADIDLANIRFPNPFVPGIRFSLATGLHVLAAHERRHLWQASQVAAARNASA